MTDSQNTQPESTPDQNIEAEQVVVNNAPDGGGVDNNEAAPEAPAESDATTEGDSDSE